MVLERRELKPIDDIADKKQPSRTEIENGIDNSAFLSRLTPRQRQAVKLYQDGCTQGEIAEELGVSQQAISKIFRCSVVKTAVLCLCD